MPPFRHTPAPHPINRFSALEAPAAVSSSKPRQSRRMLPVDGLGQRQQDRARQRTRPGHDNRIAAVRVLRALQPGRVGGGHSRVAPDAVEVRVVGDAVKELWLCHFRSIPGVAAQARHYVEQLVTKGGRRNHCSRPCERRQWLLSDGEDVVLALKAYGRGAMLIPALRKRSAANATNQSTLAALAMASRFSTASGAAPISSFFTGSSIFLPDSVRGIAATA